MRLFASLVAALAVLAANAASPAAAHLAPCHIAHSCPSDHHSYLWQGFSCTSYPDERLASDTKVVNVAGRSYFCHSAAGTTVSPATPTSSSAPASGKHGSVRMQPQTRTSGCVDGVEPDRRCSPGAYDPYVTQANIKQTICVAGYTRLVRNVPESEKQQVYAEYGISHHAPYSYEIDHVVSLELGGSNDSANLFPQSYLIQDGAHVKDKLENRLHDLVCAGKLPLRTAQQLIASDWLAAYRRYGG